MSHGVCAMEVFILSRGSDLMVHFHSSLTNNVIASAKIIEKRSSDNSAIMLYTYLILTSPMQILYIRQLAPVGPAKPP